MKRIFFVVALALFVLPSVVQAASYSISFPGFPSSANVGQSITASVRVTNSTGTGSGTASISLTIDSTYFSTSDSLTKTCAFSSSNTCDVSWSLTALKSGTKSVSAAGSSGSDTISSQSSSNVVITAPTSYTLAFTGSPASGSSLTASQSVTLSLTVQNTGQAAATSASLSLSGLTLTSGSSTVSLGTIAGGGQTTTSWTVQHDGTTTSPSASVTVTGGDTESASVSFSYSASSSSNQSTGGTTGGGGGTSTTTSGISKSWATILNRETATMAISSTLVDLTKLSFTAGAAASNVKVTVAKLASRPSSISIDPSGTIYQYISITKENISDSQINSATIEFKVNKTWMSANSIQDAGITLSRYSGGSWTALSTAPTQSDAQYSYFSATSPGFSYFAISGTKASAAPPATTTTPEPSPAATSSENNTAPLEEKKEAGAPKTSGKTTVYILIALAVIGAVFMYYEKKKKPASGAGRWGSGGWAPAKK